MKITKSQLKQIIKEELSKALGEGGAMGHLDLGIQAMSPEERARERLEDKIDRIVPEEQELARKVWAGEESIEKLSPIAQDILRGRI